MRAWRAGLELGIVGSIVLMGISSKCGVLDVACEVFDKMSQRDLVS